MGFLNLFEVLKNGIPQVNEDGWNDTFDRELIPNVNEMVVDIMTKI